MDRSYAKQTVDAVNPLARFAHRRRLKLSVGEVAKSVRTDGRVLDYGCGPGRFLADVGAVRPDVTRIGFDPYVELEFAGINGVANMNAVEDRSIDFLTVLETCEHLDDEELDVLIDVATRVVAPGGAILISVPIIGGPGLLAKEMNRYFIHRQCDYSARELLLATAGRPVGRPANIRTSHKGFDFRALKERLADHLEFQRGWLSPFPSLPAGFNSQAFTVWTTETRRESSS
jgi:SAM-dependent methyltransferase